MMGDQFLAQVKATLDYYHIEESPHRDMLLVKAEELTKSEITLEQALVILGPFMHAARNWRYQKN